MSRAPHGNVCSVFYFRLITLFVPIILSFLSEKKRKNNVYPNKKEKNTAPAEGY